MRAARGAALAIAALVAACSDSGDPAPDHGDHDDQLTYWGDVRPILAARCDQCHLRGPSSYRPWFDGYENVAQVAGAIAVAAGTREMPPWAVTADGSCGDWDRAQWLSGDEIGALQDWADSGLAEGDPADAGSPGLDPAPRSLREVDAVLDTGAEYQPALGDRLHRCFRAGLDLDAPSYLTAFDVEPGNPRAVQHVSLYSLDSDGAEEQAAALEMEDAQPGYHCFSGSRVDDSRLLGTWTWGEAAFRFPDGTGVRLEVGRDVIVQIHYNTDGGSATPDPDRTRVELELDPGVEEGRFVPLELPGLSLAPGQQRTTAAGLLAAPDSMVVRGVFPFMHSLGQRLLLLDGGGGCLAEVKHWHLYAHMRYYGYREPLRVDAGDHLWLECSYDTQSRSEPVTGGEALDAEACRVNLYATAPTE
jgi:hypothetical protein